MNRQRGTSMLEMMAGALVLIPLLFLAVDSAYVMICSKSNQELVEHAGRIAANKMKREEALTAASNIVAAFHKTDNIDSVTMERFEFDRKRKIVIVVTGMDVRMPVPLPGLMSTHLTATSVHPVVGIPAER